MRPMFARDQRQVACVQMRLQMCIKAAVRQRWVIERQGDEKLIMSVSSLFILAVIARSNINLGLLRIEMKETD